jgi:hypothetical protein
MDTTQYFSCLQLAPSLGLSNKQISAECYVTRKVPLHEFRVVNFGARPNLADEWFLT